MKTIGKWWFNGIIYGLYMDYIWILMWEIFGKPMRNLWEICGKSLVNYGKSMVNLKTVGGIHGKSRDNMDDNWG